MEERRRTKGIDQQSTPIDFVDRHREKIVNRIKYTISSLSDVQRRSCADVQRKSAPDVNAVMPTIARATGERTQRRGELLTVRTGNKRTGGGDVR